jgi:hypothetical protein
MGKNVVKGAKKCIEYIYIYLFIFCHLEPNVIMASVAKQLK